MTRGDPGRGGDEEATSLTSPHARARGERLAFVVLLFRANYFESQTLLYWMV